ncbi:MAG: hypothetical protein ACI8Y4_004523 [Candidatus Poriferisodalaceae bacterium]
MSDEELNDETPFDDPELLARLTALTESDIAAAEADGSQWVASASLFDRISQEAFWAVGPNESNALEVAGSDKVARPAFGKPRLSPSWMGRYTPALVAAGLLVMVALLSFLRSDEGFVDFELASQNGLLIEASYRVDVDGDVTNIEMRIDGLPGDDYDVWVRDVDGERVWIGKLSGDTADWQVEIDRPPSELERLWVTDPADTPILGSDL